LREEVEVGEWKAPLMALGLAGAGSGLKPDGQDGVEAPWGSVLGRYPPIMARSGCL